MLSLVLSLKRDDKRREKFFQQEFAKSFHTFNAIDAKSTASKKFITDNFNFEQAKNTYYRDITLGEAACTLSHIIMYHFFIEYTQEEYLIVCEDDAVFSQDYPILESILNSQTEFDVILFGESKVASYEQDWNYKLIGVNSQIDNYKLGRLLFDYTAGTVGYVINRRLVTAILKQHSIFWLADDFQIIVDQCNTLTERFKIGYLYPKLVIEDPSIQSNLEAERIVEQNREQSHNNKYHIQRVKKFFKKISIIIPIYRAEDFIQITLESCIQQTYKNIEIILVDDGCIDNSIKLIEPYLTDTRIKLIHHQQNKGTFSARKTGILAATGDNIIFLDADDVLLLTACEELAGYAEDDLVLFQLYYDRYQRINPTKYKLRFKNPSDFILDNRFMLDYSSAGKMYKTEVLKKTIQQLDFIQDKFVLAEDVVLFLASLINSHTIIFIKKVLYFYRYNLESTTGKNEIDTKLNQYKLALRYILKIKGLVEDPKLKRICDLFYVYMVRDAHNTRFKPNYRSRLFFHKLIAYTVIQKKS